MTITIREALRLPDMVQTRLVAGEQGQDNQIRWVTIVEVVEDTLRLQEGEFLITTGFGLEKDLEKQADFIPSLASRRLSGVAIHTGFYLREIPTSFIEAANQYGLPLIEVPSEVNFSTVTKAMLQPIINRQFETLAYSQAIHEQIIKVALSGGGLQAIANELARLTSGSVSILDAYGFELVHAVAAPSFDSQLQAPFTEKESTQTISIRAKENYGSLTLSKITSQWQDLDQIALQHAATLCALEFVKEQAISETEWRMQGDFVEELISGRLSWSHEVESRCRMLGFPLQGKQIVAALRLHEDSVQLESTVHQRKLSALIKRMAERQRLSYLIRERAKMTLVILPEGPTTYKMLQQLLEQWNNILDAAPLCIGHSEPKDQYIDWSVAVDEAEFALTVQPLLLHSPSIVAYAQLEGYQFLFPFHRQPASLQSLWHPMLHRIIQYDRKHSQQLLETLHTYLLHNANGLQAAQALFIHRHTLKYRLQLIEERAGVSLGDSSTRWQLQLAVMAYRLHRLLYPHM
ncbi:PucR family transcriptional regulator [Brevibacillus sp. SYSU BS000544]|uniref:PucR family transcriptional regulator n=1 Tax=Brevibacillus sp. SYSU BS000544 TaxID=3416443 RepID=UPI003CE58149